MKTESYIVERVSEGLFVLEREDKTKLVLEAAKMNIACKSGDVLILCDGKFSLDVEQTKLRRERIQQKTRNLFKNST